MLSRSRVQGHRPPPTGRPSTSPDAPALIRCFLRPHTIRHRARYVTFEPGARSAWHTHPAGQRLIVVSGVGRTQEWGKPVQVIRPGDVVWCPPGVKHWHGAAPDTAMTHLAVTGAVDGRSVTWMEKVIEEHTTVRAPGHVPDSLRQTAGHSTDRSVHGHQRHAQAQRRVEPGPGCRPDGQRGQGNPGAALRLRRLSPQPQCAGRTDEGGGGAQATRHSGRAWPRTQPRHSHRRRTARGRNGQSDQDLRRAGQGAGVRFRPGHQSVSCRPTCSATSSSATTSTGKAANWRRSARWPPRRAWSRSCARTWPPACEWG